jgi:hypothetical protein
MKKSGIVWPGAVGFIVRSVLVFGIPLCWVPEASRSEYFWHRVLWVEFLNFLLWLPHCSKILSNGGILPTLGESIGHYCLLSFSLLMLHAVLPTFDFLNRCHLVGQLLLGMIFLGFWSTLAYLAYIAQPTKLQLPPGAHAPAALTALLQNAENAIVSPQTFDARECIKEVREKIRYSLALASSPSSVYEYAQLDAKVVEFTNWVMSLNASTISDAELKAITEKSKQILQIVELLKQSK